MAKLVIDIARNYQKWSYAVRNIRNTRFDVIYRYKGVRERVRARNYILHDFISHILIVYVRVCFVCVCIVVHVLCFRGDGGVGAGVRWLGSSGGAAG